MPYPPNSGNGYYGRSGMPSDGKILEVENATKDFMQMQYEQNKSFTETKEEQFAMLKNISRQLEHLNGGVSDFQNKISNAETRISSFFEAQTSLINRMSTKRVTLDENPFAAANAIQVRKDDNVRMMAELRPRSEREDESARKNKI